MPCVVAPVTVDTAAVNRRSVLCCGLSAGLGVTFLSRTRRLGHNVQFWSPDSARELHIVT